MKKKSVRLGTLLLGLWVLFCHPSCLTQGDYDKQVIAVLEDRPDLIEGAEFLYMKHPAASEIVVWRTNEENFYHYDVAAQLVKGKQVNNEYSGRQRIQVVGHGSMELDEIEGHMHVKMSGFDGTELGRIVSKLIVTPADGQTTEIKTISLIGCELAPDHYEAKTSTTTTRGLVYTGRQRFLSKAIASLKGHGILPTALTARSHIVGINLSGQKMIGTMQQDSIKWNSKQAFRSGYKSILSRQEDNRYKLENAKVSFKGRTEQGSNPDMNSGIMSHMESLLIHKIGSDLKVKKSNRLTSEVAYSLLHDSASQLYNSLNLDDPVETETVIIRKKLGGSDDGYWARKVRKITGEPHKFMTELKRQAEQYKDGGWREKTNPDNNDFHYYRYGDWVYKMTKHNLYMKLEGVVASEFAPRGYQNQKKRIGKDEIRQELANIGNVLKNEEVEMEPVPDEYHQMRDKTTDIFMERARHWMYGHDDHDQLRMPIFESDQVAQSYDGQMTLAMFVSESVRNFRNHPTNVMGMDLVEKKFLSQKEFLDESPMTRGGTWQEKKYPNSVVNKRKMVGMEPIGKRIIDDIEEDIGPKEKMTEFSVAWLARMKASCRDDGRFAPGGDNRLLGSFNKPGWQNVEEGQTRSGDSLFQAMTDNIVERMNKRDHTGEFTRYNTKLLSDEPVSVREVEATQNDVECDHHFNDEIAPSMFSSNLAVDQGFINKQIEREVQQIRNQHPDKEVEINSDSIETEENEVSFDVVWGKSAYPPSEGKSKVTVQIDETNLLTKRKLDQFHERTRALKSRGAL